MISVKWTAIALAPADGLGPHKADWKPLHLRVMASHPMLDAHLYGWAAAQIR